MSPNFSIIVIIIYLCEVQLIFTIDNELTQIEENLLYANLNTPSNLSLFYQKLLKSNGIDDITRIDRIITQEDIQQLNLENKVSHQTQIRGIRSYDFQCFQSSDDLLNAFNIKTNSINDNFNRSDIHRLLSALVNVKFNEGCSKSGGRVTWKSSFDYFF